MAEQAKSHYLLADTIEISRRGSFTCPVNTVAVFVHNRDEVLEESEVLRLFEDCKELQDVQRL